LGRFQFHNINFIKEEKGKRLIVQGELENYTGSNFSAVAVRMVIFNKNIPMANFVFVVNSVPCNQSKFFEKNVEDLDYDQVHDLISRYDIYVESAY